MKRSRQRDAIIGELCSRKDHPTAEELYLSLKPEYPNLSLGTVYRNLNLLTEENLIKKLTSDGADHFDGKIDEHCHFICTECKKIYDIDYPLLDGIDEKVQNITGDRVESHSLMFYGICRQCL